METQTASATAQQQQPEPAGAGAQALVPAKAPSPIITWAATKFAVNAGQVFPILKATCFSVGKDEPPATDAEVAALLIVSKEYGLNPFLKQIFAFRDKKGGIVPVVGVDGWSVVINNHPQFDGVKFEWEKDDKGNIAACTAIIFRKDRQHPTELTEYMGECKRSTGPWNSHPRRMLRHKALIQCARVALGLTGIHDEDEAERIIGAGPAEPSSPGEGLVIREGEFQSGTRTEQLAGELARRVRETKDALNPEGPEVVDVEAGEVPAPKVESIATVTEKVKLARSQEDLAPILQIMLSLPATAERAELMKAWNARVMELKEPDNAPKAEAPADVEKAGLPLPVDPVAAVTAPVATATPQAPKPPAELDEAAADRVVARLTACTSTDDLDIEMDAQVGVLWPTKLKQKIQAAYRDRRAGK